MILISLSGPETQSPFVHPVLGLMKSHCAFEVNSKLDELNKSSQKCDNGEAMYVPLTLTLDA